MSNFEITLALVMGALAGTGAGAYLACRRIETDDARRAGQAGPVAAQDVSPTSGTAAARPGSSSSCQWIASISGLAGSALLASKGEFAGFGFVAFLASNVGWLAYGLRTRTWSLVVMQAGFTVTSIIGIKNWLVL